MDDFRELTTKEKALKINLNASIYGSFAEIGAGQEIAAHFFKAGGASGTVAKTMSAYDMTFSDAIYGKSGRYVSEERLVRMLDKEFSLLVRRLAKRGKETCFFALANTVETLNYRRTNQGHGWIGVRYQLHPNQPPNDCIMHVLLHDKDNVWQQQAIGIIGVNLMFACYYYSHDIDHFLTVLMENIAPGRVEVDMLRLIGPDFEEHDNRLLALKLVKSGMTNAAMFGPDGDVQQPSEALYKKNVLVLRGRFRPVTHVNLDMLRAGLAQFEAEPDVEKDDLFVLTELTLNALTDHGRIDDQDFLDRVDILCSLGQNVMISNYQEYYRLVSYLSPYARKKKIGIILGVFNLEDIFKEEYYTNLKGGILESFGVLFGSNVKMYVYPSRKEYSEELYSCDNFELPPQLFSLFRYLFDNNKLEDIQDANIDLLHITSDDVLSMIREGKPGWENMVPKIVGDTIKEKGLFGYKEPVTG
ncbi:MAG: TonB-dependent receptor [Bacteroidota bacterium]